MAKDGLSDIRKKRADKRNEDGSYKTDPAVIEERVAKIAEWIVLGHTRSSILRQTTDWGSERWIEELMKRARAIIVKDTEEDRQEAIKKGIARYEMLFLRNMDRGAFAEARKVQAELCKLLGLNAESRDLEDGDAAAIVDALRSLKAPETPPTATDTEV